jgi:hypothetical protein
LKHMRGRKHKGTRERRQTAMSAHVH